MSSQVISLGSLSTNPKQKCEVTSCTPLHLLAQEARNEEAKYKNHASSIFDIRELVHYEFVSQSVTVNAKWYVEILNRLK